MVNEQLSKVLEVNNLSFSYPGVDDFAVENINLTLQSKTINMLIGPNGSGKSTLIRLILGILKGKGEINFFENGKIITRDEAHIGYVPQKRIIDTTIPLTVSEFLTLTQKICKRCTRNSKDEIVNTLQKVNALEYQHKKLGDLSGGQLQRVILARALLHHPKILILDEPESGIDVQGEKFFYEVLQKLVKEENVTALVATHEMEVVHKYADLVLCINKTLVCFGNTAQTLTAQTFEKLYGGHSKAFSHTHVAKQEGAHEHSH